MSSYTTVENVRALFRGIDLGNNTVINEPKIESWIAKQSSYIDSRLGGYYLLPFGNAATLEVLDLIASYKVAHMIKTVLEMTTQIADNVQMVQGNLDKKAEEMLDRMLPSKDGTKPIGPLIGAEVIVVSTSAFNRMSLQQRGSSFTKNGNNW